MVFEKSPAWQGRKRLSVKSSGVPGQDLKVFKLGRRRPILMTELKRGSSAQPRKALGECQKSNKGVNTGGALAVLALRFLRQCPNGDTDENTHHFSSTWMARSGMGVQLMNSKR
ncbi:hypothetical protein [Pseudomonas sp. TH31]|uniref:hypothetical protein n=1 Tax=Pseudomonas sp. TH31 TaxID=2796396 RepID=UPI001914CD31|nr:hypothetical protein [Pseudomonas sp. TH31]MBK5414187.1 hypothetical protein [Pseudomonas sp. TH31]